MQRPTQARTIATLALAFAAITPNILPAGPAMAAVQATDARAYIQGLTDRAFAVLRDASAGDKARTDKFQTLVLEGFAVKSIGRRVLARHGRSASPQQLAEYDSVFPRYMVTIYQTRLIDYKDATIKVVKVEQIDEQNQIVHTLVSGASLQEPVKADWVVRKTDGGFKIVDLYIQGVSLVITQQADFAARIDQAGSAQKGIQELITLMRKTQTASAK